MAVEWQAPEDLSPEQIAQLEAAQADATEAGVDIPQPEKKRRGRKPGSKNTTTKTSGGMTKEMLRQCFEMAAAGIYYVEQSRPYALSVEEITALTDTWYEVIKLYPSMGKYIAAGNKFTIWGNALVTTIFIVDAKVKAANALQIAHTAGAAHPNSRQERNGQDDISAENFINEALSDYPRL